MWRAKQEFSSALSVKKQPSLVWCIRSLQKGGHVCQSSFSGFPVLTYRGEKKFVGVYICACMCLCVCVLFGEMVFGLDPALERVLWNLFSPHATCDVTATPHFTNERHKWYQKMLSVEWLTFSHGALELYSPSSYLSLVFVKCRLVQSIH